MELKDYFKKVGSDPCLVLDFHANAEMASASAIHVDTEFGEFENEIKAREFIDKFSKMFEKETKTRLVSIRNTIVSADNTLSGLIGNVIIVNQFIFNTGTYGRSFTFYILIGVPSGGVKIATGDFVVQNHGDYAKLIFRTTIDLS